MKISSSIALIGAVPIVFACANVDTDACAAAFSKNVASASTFCATYTKTTNTANTGLPTWAATCSTYKHYSSACSCWAPGATGVASVPTVISQVLVKTTLSTVVKTSPTSVVNDSSALVVSSAKATSIAAAATGASTITSVSVGVAPASCTVTEYASIAAAQKNCKDIVLFNLAVPASSTLSLTALQTGGSVTFAGKTTFGTTADEDFDPVVITGTNVVITGAPGNVIDGNGQAYWDGQGSNGGDAKPDHFIVVKKSTNIVVQNLNIQNWPTHALYISGNNGAVFQNIVMDNSAGDAANSKSDGDPAAHNSDGFDISASDTITLYNIKVYNQDDCVAVTSGSNILVDSMYCSGGHGLSIGSIGGKSNNTVDTVTFSNSQIVDSENGARIKTNSGTSDGTVRNVIFKNIKLSNIAKYGIDVQQDYLNGGPTGDPTNGDSISNIQFIDVTGTVASSGIPYYILCGVGSCSDFVFSGVSVTGGKASSCNYPSTGCPS
ncbi:glycoside hydrolase family 28 protein [Amniculicola lignicola CBS 123094]|uniref:endo-polygalacturonase n=1 Tax=Amniculicola lignicola CBS 123094 TaxID=1392246 RepID=A0A6A5W610_9PLEO|nr:glycoside hydrolase family 28 protein [Amniculicola lignicola CBS 123094]